MLLELRVGRSGLGDDWLYQYVPGEGWEKIGRYLEVRTAKLKFGHSIPNIVQGR